MSKKTVFVRVPRTFDQEDCSNLTTVLEDELGSDYSVVLMSDSIEFMTADEVREFGEALIELGEQNG
ncbi:hypothetical protein M1M34_gp111 [Haloarcula tailed virus 2]|uniref:Uncharacterized protein n=1 Tax=Haloarcula tailed virus 2 TaxID=2877989 RepID=A0AAE8XYT3_9CAUD|nr:hypothetical protein M1M34_gp111 [Haloarcula tailed virus 2]UBF23222.1 hypothetical protein HATV-2_gp71 [Haloarcula tailed virus 2]